MQPAIVRKRTAQKLPIRNESTVPGTNERRNAERVDLGGRYMIRVDPCDGRVPIVCKVLDYSVTGVRLEIPHIADVSGVVRVLIGDIAHRAQIVWRQGDVIGVDFIDEHHDIV